MAHHQAQDQVQAALKRFEQALAAAEKVFEETLQVREERDRLQEQLEELRRRAHELKNSNRMALARMDSAMGRIRSLLEQV